jgi:hypothetical protein
MENGTTVLFGLPGVAVQLVEWGEPSRLAPMIHADRSVAGDGHRAT